MIAPAQGNIATSIGDRIVIDGVDLDFPAIIGTNGQVLGISDAPLGELAWITTSAGVTDHGALTGLSDDDHSVYGLLAGRAGGQTLIGGTASGENLTLSSTAHATKGYILMTDGSNVGIGPAATSPGVNETLLVAKNHNFITQCAVRNTTDGTGSQTALVLFSKSGATDSNLGVNLCSGSFSGTSYGISNNGLGVIQTSGVNTGGLVVGTLGAKPLYFGTNSLLAMTIDTTQQVGIGTDTPDSLLHLYSTSAVTMTIERDGAGAGAFGFLDFVADDDAGTSKTYGRISGFISDNAAATAEGQIDINILVSNVMTGIAEFKDNEVAFKRQTIIDISTGLSLLTIQETSVASGDFGAVYFRADDDAANQDIFAAIISGINANASGAERGYMKLQVAASGAAVLATRIEMDEVGIGFYGTAPAAQGAAYTRNATIVEDRTLLASASATVTNNNNVLAALIADLQAVGLVA